MTGSTLEDLPPGGRVFIDATTFIYHFSRASQQCRRFLLRCERGEVFGVTSVSVLLEVAHRLLILEAIAAGVVPAGRAVRLLQERPELVRGLRRHSAQVAEIATWGVEVLSLDVAACVRAGEMRARHGLLTNDSVVVAIMEGAGIEAIATSDADFRRVEGLRVFAPTDLVSPHPPLA